jgi:uncharacterized protein (TIGR03083 family)
VAVAATASSRDRFTCSVKGKRRPEIDVPYRARVGQTAVADAFAAEAAALQGVVSGLTESDLSGASPCPPWMIGELLCHVLIGADRISQALSQPADASGPLITTVQYYRPDKRFSAATNADRIETARALAARLGDSDAIAAELVRRCRESFELLTTAPADAAIRTRHGDRMLLTDFAGTRVVELALHGLDLAIGMDMRPWMTGAAADVLVGLLLPDGGGDQLCARLNCDRVGLIARLTGRATLSATEAQLLAGPGITRLALG